MTKGTRTSSIFKTFLLLELFLFELFVLGVMTSYRYFHNSGASTPFSNKFLSFFFDNYNFFFTGNLIWFLLFIVSAAALITIFRNKNNAGESSLKWMLISSLILMLFLIFSVLFPTSPAIDELTNRLIQLNAKGTKIISLCIFAGLYLFMTVSLCIIAFSVLKKFYFFRAGWLTILVVFASLITVFMIINFYGDDREILDNPSVKIDAGVVLGAAVWGGNRPSPVLRERINKGYELFKNKNVNYLVLTGGGAPGEMTEAEVAKQELIKKGVDEKYILLENKSNSTLEQVRFVKRSLNDRNKWDEIAVISDNFHLFRTKQICRFFGMNIYTISSDAPVSAESGFNFMIKESVAVMLFWLFGIG